MALWVLYEGQYKAVQSEADSKQPTPPVSAAGPSIADPDEQLPPSWQHPAPVFSTATRLASVLGRIAAGCRILPGKALLPPLELLPGQLTQLVLLLQLLPAAAALAAACC